MAKANGPSCRSTTPAGNGLKWNCTRSAGHKGLHAAAGVDGLVIHRWKRRSTSRRAPAIFSVNTAHELEQLLEDGQAVARVPSADCGCDCHTPGSDTRHIAPCCGY
ncbi:hypothetical protein [Mycobacteroides abscessus]|uniref:hypothetical protein n=1 Tax=Mycobacteroides abscessus TaxID=36809 RepID=UPI0011C3E6B0|nr:hypothetical protein [Mycobacteroides abscessus]